MLPSADAWVYPHSSNPGQESVLRVWGDGETILDPVHPSEGTFSYAFMQWKLREAASKPLKAARLELYIQSHADLSDEDMKASPLVAVPLTSSFEENTYMSTNVEPRPQNQVLGKAKAEKSGENWKLTIDLLSEEGKPFVKLAEAAGKGNKVLSIALVSKMSPAESRGHIYRIYSKEASEALRPRLFLEWEE
jgi:hypothetical protein